MGDFSKTFKITNPIRDLAEQPLKHSFTKKFEILK